MKAKKYEHVTYFQTINPENGTMVEITIKTKAADLTWDERQNFHEHFVRGADRLLRAHERSDVPLGCRIIGNTSA